MNEHDRRKVAFLDTNALHYVGTFLNYVRKIGLHFSLEKNTIYQLNECLNRVSEKRLKDGLKMGMNTILFLASEGIQIEYSPVSELELLSGRAKGRAIEKMAKERVPDRMWSRLTEFEIRDRLVEEDFVDIATGVVRLENMLSDAGITVTASDAERTRDVLELAKTIAGLVYMGAEDSIIYASAIVAQADYLVTGDRYLRKTANLIYNPSGRAPYEMINGQLQSLSDGRLPEPRDCNRITL